MMTPQKSRFLVTSALIASALLGGSLVLSACGKLGSLEEAPPLYGADAKSDWSASNLPGGGNTATMSSSASKDTEKAKPDANGRNAMDDPYVGNKKVEDAPLEGFGNATTFNNNNPK